jgi:hypothetical protein
LRVPGILRKRVIEANGAPDDEKSVCDLMQGAGSVLASFAVNDQFAHLERLLQAGFRADLYGAPLSQNDCMGFGSGKAAGGKQQNNDEYAKRAHGSPIIWLCTKRAEIVPMPLLEY